MGMPASYALLVAGSTVSPSTGASPTAPGSLASVNLFELAPAMPTACVLSPAEEVLRMDAALIESGRAEVAAGALM
jgi:hypothetical protein